MCYRRLRWHKHQHGNLIGEVGLRFPKKSVLNRPMAGGVGLGFSSLLLFLLAAMVRKPCLQVFESRLSIICLICVCLCCIEKTRFQIKPNFHETKKYFTITTTPIRIVLLAYKWIVQISNVGPDTFCTIFHGDSRPARIRALSFVHNAAVYQPKHRQGAE